MKIIVSTKTLASEIKKALDNRTTHFEVGGEKIKFDGNDSFHWNICMAVGHGKMYYRGVFKRATWHHMLDFVKQLGEQPIVIEFREYMHTEVHERPEITLSQFIKCF